MASPKTRKNFLDTEEGKDIKVKLQMMTTEGLYNTAPSYNNNTVLYPDNLIPFVDKHIAYLVNHPMVEPSKYLANVRIITRIRE